MTPEQRAAVHAEAVRLELARLGKPPRIDLRAWCDAGRLRMLTDRLVRWRGPLWPDARPLAVLVLDERAAGMIYHTEHRFDPDGDPPGVTVADWRVRRWAVAAVSTLAVLGQLDEVKP